MIHQDYLHWRQPWIPAQMELLAPCFELVAWCQRGTAVFRCTAPVTERRLTAGRTEALDDLALRACLMQAIRRFPKGPQRRQLARSVAALADNPGQREAYRFALDPVPDTRLAAILAEAAGGRG